MSLYAIGSSAQIDLTLHEAFSGISGAISLASWIFLLVPQLVLNYRSGNADGISVLFLSVWMLGDITNLSGALWASLVPTVVIIAFYFCLTDTILITQTLYYKCFKTKKNSTAILSHSSTTGSASAASESTALLSEQPTSDTGDLAGGCSPLAPVSQKYVKASEKNQRYSWLSDIISLLAVIFFGIVGWVVAYYVKLWIPTPSPSNPSSSDTITNTPIGAQILGYVSALCYLTARIPQIIKNHRQKSCEGLAILFFLLSLLGNATYGLSILCHSLQRQYVITNLPWLIGSLGTMAEDLIIFLQFRHYSNPQKCVDHVYTSPQHNP